MTVDRFNRDTLQIRRTSVQNIFAVYSDGPGADVLYMAARRAKSRETWRIVRSKRCRDATALFNEFAAALQFPWYFGDNWGAFDECLHDLSWLDAGNVYVIIDNFVEMLRDDASKKDRIVNYFIDSKIERDAHVNGDRNLIVVLCAPLTAANLLNVSLLNRGIEVKEDISFEELTARAYPSGNA